MGTADLRLGDAFKLLLIGGAVGAVGIFILSSIKSVEFERRANLGRRRAYPSFFWDLRDPGASSANFELKPNQLNNIPREGMFSAPDPNFENPNFSGLEGYVAPRSL